MQARKYLYTSLLTTLIATAGYASLTFAQTDTPKPSSLTLTKTDDATAIIAANFPFSETRQKEIRIQIGKEAISLFDDGSNGDVRAGDNIFSSKVPFDFSSFAKANAQLANNKNLEKMPIFAAGDRQILGTQSLRRSLDGISITSLSGKTKFSFSLPTDAKLIKQNQAINLPLINLPLALPLDIDLAPAAVSIPHSLMITSTNVVSDPTRTWACAGPNSTPSGNATGDWTFWQQMENMANGTASTSDFIKKLFKHWTVNQTINSFIVNARPNVYQKIIEEWELRSGGPGAILKPEESPFRLLGIVPRLDLRGGTGPYAGGDAGEGRFVFTLHDGHCNNLSKTIILEYKVPINGCTNIRSWAQKWIDLASSSNYNDDLASLTQVFTAAGANPSGPNQSAISQVRTNEFLAGSPQWQLREFVLPATGGFLMQTDTKQEPHISLNNSITLAKYINANWPLLVGPPAAQHTVPLMFNGSAFAAGSAPDPVLWSAPNAFLTVPTTPAPVTPPPATIRDDALFQLALNTCSGCHQMETSTSFAHLHYNSTPGMPALLSGFLTGVSLPDPRNPAIVRSFNDLARRAVDIDIAANMSCLKSLPIGNVLVNQFTSPAVLRSPH